MDRIYIHHSLWEDANNGMYENYKGDKNLAIEEIVKIFTSYDKTFYLMERVILEWKYCCKHNLTNTGMNRIAWLGQACCNIENKYTEDIVKIAWSYVPEKYQEQANNIAKLLINKWVCLNE